MVHIHTETPLEKANLSFVSNGHLEIGSRLGMVGAGTPSGLDPCGLMHTASVFVSSYVYQSCL